MTRFALFFLFVSVPAVSVLAEDRSYDGSGNNLTESQWGAAETPLQRMAAAAYADGESALAGKDRPNPRLVSNLIAEQRVLSEDQRGLSDMTWVWGQFLDHDIALVLPTEDEFIPIMTEPNDKMAPMIPMTRSRGTMKDNVREQINSVSAFIDGSNLYGSSEERALALRVKEGGLLHTSASGRLLPKNFEEIEMENPHDRPITELFMAGDVRANENPALLAMHTLWLREHNRLADQLAQENPEWSDAQLYQRARRIVSAEMQAITYQEFLAALLGPFAPKVEDAVYDPALNGTLFNEFSGALYRIGHTMVSAHIMRMRDDGSVPAEGGFVFKDSFFDPDVIENAETVDLVLKGVATKPMQQIDPFVVDALRNFLFADQGAGGMDLIAINLQRGRDHGLPSYNDVREVFGLSRRESFESITSDGALAKALEEAYGDTDKLDLWIAAMAEDHLMGASVGETVATVLARQFRHLRDGDRFFFMHDPGLTDAEKAQIRATTLADVIKRNTDLTHLQDRVFISQPRETWRDTDGDGVTDIREAIARTDPTDPDSSLRVIRFTRAAGGEVTLDWSSVPGKEYLIDYSASLEGSWEVVATVLAETGETQHQLSRHAPVSGFYRIAVRD